MTEPENFLEKFLERWSRRKLAATEIAAGEAPRDDERSEQAGAQNKIPTDVAADPAAPVFDPASLPPIESINAASDVRAFLAPGVPIEFTRAALRRAWMTDPSIRDFIGIAENQWDFGKPDSVPGFGSLELTPELRRMAIGLFGETPERPTPQPAAEARRDERIAEMPAELPSRVTPMTVDEGNAAIARSQQRNDPVPSGGSPPDSLAVVPQDSKNNAATQKGIDQAHAGQRSDRRKHGSAVPK